MLRQGSIATAGDRDVIADHVRYIALSSETHTSSPFCLRYGALLVLWRDRELMLSAHTQVPCEGFTPHPHRSTVAWRIFSAAPHPLSDSGRTVLHRFLPSYGRGSEWAHRRPRFWCTRFAPPIKSPSGGRWTTHSCWGARGLLYMPRNSMGLRSQTIGLRPGRSHIRSAFSISTIRHPVSSG